MSVRTIYSLFLMLFLAVPALGKWEMSEFMISAWSVPSGGQDQAKAKLLAEAGLNTVMWDADKLDLCAKHGLKVMVMKTSPKKAPDISKHPAVWGYYIMDEPLSTDKFPELAKTIKDFRKADPEHVSYINMIPRRGKWLEEYIESVKPELLSYDYYQWWWGMSGSLWGEHSGHYAILEQFRKTALDADIPLICWVESNANPEVEWGGGDGKPPADNEQKLRLSVYTALAYGIKGIQWFTANMMFDKDPLRLNHCGKGIAAINAELKHLGPVLVKLKSTDVFHTKPVPKGCKEPHQDNWVHIDGEPAGAGLVMGLFEDKEKKDYIMVCNRSHHDQQQAVIYFRETPKLLEKLDKHTGKWKKISISGASRGFAFFLDPGDGELMRIQRGPQKW